MLEYMEITLLKRAGMNIDEQGRVMEKKRNRETAVFLLVKRQDAVSVETTL